MKFLDHLEEWLIAFLMGAATIVIFVAVLHRYASGWPIPGLQDWLIQLNTSWAQELTIYMFVWMAKFGAAYGVRTGIHVGVDVLINRLDTPWRNKFIVFGLLAGALFTGVVGTLGFNTASLTSDGGYYIVSFSGTPTDNSFTLQAVPQGAQSSDACKNLTLTNTGAKSQTGDETNGKCW